LKLKQASSNNARWKINSHQFKQNKNNYPLLWSRDFEPKPALDAVLNVPAMMKN